MIGGVLVLAPRVYRTSELLSSLIKDLLTINPSKDIDPSKPQMKRILL